MQTSLGQAGPRGEPEPGQSLPAGAAGRPAAAAAAFSHTVGCLERAQPTTGMNASISPELWARARRLAIIIELHRPLHGRGACLRLLQAGMGLRATLCLCLALLAGGQCREALHNPIRAMWSSRVRAGGAGHSRRRRRRRQRTHIPAGPRSLPAPCLAAGAAAQPTTAFPDAYTALGMLDGLELWKQIVDVRPGGSTAAQRGPRRRLSHRF